MAFVFDRDLKQNSESLPIAESEILIVGLDERSLRKRYCRRFLTRLALFVTLILVGHAIYKGVSAYRLAHNVECVAYEGGTTTVNIPIVDSRSKVLIDSSVSSGEVFITHVKSESNQVTLTLESEDETPKSVAGTRLCTLKGRKITGLGIYTRKDKKGDRVSPPVIKSLKIEVPKSIPAPSISLLSPKYDYSGLIKLFRRVGVWN